MPKSPSPLTEQIKSAMAHTNDLFNTEVFGNRNFAALDQIYTTGARILPPMPTGEGLVEIGQASLKVEPEGQSAAQMDVKYVVYWQQEDGLWKWHVDIWNTNS